MLENVAPGAEVDKRDYSRQAEDLRYDLLQTQMDLMQSRRNALVVVAGSDALGRHECINLLHEWMDPRGLAVNAYDEPTDEERLRPRYWRYWRTLPPVGRLAVYANAWTERAIQHHLMGRLDDAGFDSAIRHVRRFERMLADDGTLIVKFWFHIDRLELSKRRSLAQQDPDEHWQFSVDDKRMYRHYERSQEIVSRALRETHTDSGRWHVIDGTERRYRNLTFGRILLTALRDHIAHEPPTSALRHAKQSILAETDILQNVDLAQKLPKSEYEKRLGRAQRRLLTLSRKARQSQQSSILVFEGWDAAGKGGCIRRMTAAMDAEHYRVIPIQAPTDEEKAHHYLWRFWRHLPLDGHCTIFDRSWYGRVLVERIEGFCTDIEWRRAYDEINEFEEQLADHGIVVLKFWLHIDKAEQLKRFKSREKTPRKRHKITDEDYRNRRKWKTYQQAANDMIERTTTEFAPWHLIPANDKRYARIRIIETMCETLKQALDQAGR